MVAALAMVCTLAAQAPVTPPEGKTAQALPPGIRWTIDLPAAPAAPPVVAAERVFISMLPGVVAVHDLKDGRPLWRETLTPEQPLAVDGERVLIAGNDAVHAFRVETGAAEWRTATGPTTAPLLAKDGWIIAATENRLFAIRASDGGVIWSQDSGPQTQRPAISGDLLFVPLASGSIRALDLTTGALRWERRFAGSPAEPLVVGDRLYVGATDKKFHCLRTSDGEIDWSFQIGAIVRGAAATDGERVFVAALDNLVRAFTIGSGSQKWQQGVPFRPFGGPLVQGSTVIVAGPTADVRLLNVLDGRETGKVTFPEPLALAPAFGVTGVPLAVAGITGGLTQSWKLWLASVVRTGSGLDFSANVHSR